MLWHSMDKEEIDKSIMFYETLKAVKDAHPKTAQEIKDG